MKRWRERINFTPADSSSPTLNLAPQSCQDLRRRQLRLFPLQAVAYSVHCIQGGLQGWLSAAVPIVLALWPGALVSQH
jgi:hypothetical protein